MDPELEAMLAPSLRHVLTAASDQPLEVRLTELGWDEVIAEHRADALRLLFELKGDVLSSADALDLVMVEPLLDVIGLSRRDNALLALPASLHPGYLSSCVDRDHLSVRTVGTRPATATDHVVVPVEGDGHVVRLAVVGGDEYLECTALEGMDPALGLVALEGEVPGDVVEWSDGAASGAAWQASVVAGRWALAAELLGIAGRVAEDVTAYACDRRQYGRPIGSFQAVQHRLAAAHAALVGATAVVGEAARTGAPSVAMLAKAVAGRAAEEMCAQAQQVYGAIGFTWEHAFHRHLRRVYVLDRMLGDWRTLEAEIGTELRATRRVPRIGGV